MRVLATMLIVKTSFKVLLDPCTLPAQTQYASYISFLSDVLKYNPRRFLLSPHVSSPYSTSRTSSERHRENWTVSLSPDIFLTSMISPLYPTLQPLPWKLCDGEMLHLLVCLRNSRQFLICCLIPQLAVPHFLDVEDEYKGYRLPAGSIIIPNAWSLMFILFCLNYLTTLFEGHAS